MDKLEQLQNMLVHSNKFRDNLYDFIKIMKHHYRVDDIMNMMDNFIYDIETDLERYKKH